MLVRAQVICLTDGHFDPQAGVIGTALVFRIAAQQSLRKAKYAYMEVAKVGGDLEGRGYL